MYLLYMTCCQQIQLWYFECCQQAICTYTYMQQAIILLLQGDAPALGGWYVTQHCVQLPGSLLHCVSLPGLHDTKR